MPYLPTYRAAVNATDCDHLGHMNVSRYFAACSDAMFAIQTALGLGRSAVAGERALSFAVVHAESDFRAELLAGDVMEMETGILSLGTKSALFHHRLIRVEDGTLAFESEFRSVCLNLKTRRAEPIPDDIRAAAAAYMVEKPA
ncbi:MAG: acyl-CoA thioesterase [Rhodobacteraceae bacterium]|nr:acyl-CoA thioesterase [Paracoccaceae bacterium]